MTVFIVIVEGTRVIWTLQQMYEDISLLLLIVIYLLIHDNNNHNLCMYKPELAHVSHQSLLYNDGNSIFPQTLQQSSTNPVFSMEMEVHHGKDKPKLPDMFLQ